MALSDDARAIIEASGEEALKAAITSAMCGYLRAAFEIPQAQAVIAQLLTCQGWTCTPPPEPKQQPAPRARKRRT